MKKTILRLAEKLGYTIVRTQRLQNLAMASRLHGIFAKYKIETVIDVGANEGQYRDFLRMEVGFEGTIESFEPLPELAARLKQRAAREDPEWLIHASALGAQAGTREMNIMAGSVFSSFRAPIQVASDTQRAMNTVVGTAVVPVTTLDVEFGNRRADLHHTYLKLDTQGFDLEVLRGGKQVVADLPALQTEVSFCPFYENVPDYKRAIAEFENHGFVVADFFLVCTDGTHRAMEFDCVMIQGAD
jgi:FkbM family methyltransferase